MGSQYIGVFFDKQFGLWFGMVNIVPAERPGLPDHLKGRLRLDTDHHKKEEDAARAVDK